MISFRVLNGREASKYFEFEQNEILIGREATDQVCLSDAEVSRLHARVVRSPFGYTVFDNQSTHGSSVERGGNVFPLSTEEGQFCLLQKGDVIVLGQGTSALRLYVDLKESPEADPTICAVKPIRDFELIHLEQKLEVPKLRELYEVQRKLSHIESIDAIYDAISQGIFSLLPRATHVTLLMKEEGSSSSKEGKLIQKPELMGQDYFPVFTRSRSQDEMALVPTTRSVLRKVLSEKAMVLATDAERDMGSTASLLRSQIKSTLGVPLWQGSEVLGVLQVDNRESVGMFLPHDLDVASILAGSVSLALSNARLLAKLKKTEETLSGENKFLKTKHRERLFGVSEKDKEFFVSPLIGESSAMSALFSQIKKVIDTRVSILIYGETGTGKELVASKLHYESKRKHKLFVPQNCASMPAALLESELFGHKKGSFTSAHEDKKGLCEIADGGTLFLDEVSEMPFDLQAKLLRFLQEGEVKPVGSNKAKYVDVRVIAACNRDLLQEVKARRFREDLYYRLNVFPILVPPLREREHDVLLIAEHFLTRTLKEMGKERRSFSEEAKRCLLAYPFPGNVRELQNEMLRLAVELEPKGEDVPEFMLSSRFVSRTSPSSLQNSENSEISEDECESSGESSLKNRVSQFEKQMIRKALEDNDQNRTKTAEALGISREGLHKKLKTYGL